MISDEIVIFNFGYNFFNINEAFFSLILFEYECKKHIATVFIFLLFIILPILINLFLLIGSKTLPNAETLSSISNLSYLSTEELIDFGCKLYVSSLKCLPISKISLKHQNILKLSPIDS